MSNKHALIIGINRYQFMEPRYQLSGCVNDAKLIKSTLIRKFNFNRHDIVSLYDEDATREAILQAMQTLLNRIADNDIVVFHFSGHGQSCRVKTQFTDEGSGKLNSILPCDDSEPTTVDAIESPDGVIWREIREHQINQWLQELTKKAANITLIFDACHSGTITRSSNKTKARTVPLHVRNQVISEQQLAPQEHINLSKPKISNWLTLSDKFVVISGCRDTQESQEVDFQEGMHRFRHGVLTYHLCQVLNDAVVGTTFRDIFETVSSKVVMAVENQNPLIEGTIDREVFGVKDIVPLSYLPIKTLLDDEVILDGGAAHGVSLDSLWDIYPPFTKVADTNQRIGNLKIIELEPLQCRAEIMVKTAEIVSGSRCVLAYQATPRFAVNVDVSMVPPAQQRALINRIKRTELVEVSAANEQANLVVQIAQHAQELADFHLPEDSTNSIDFPAWVVFNKQQKLAMPLHSVSDRSIEVVLVENFKKIARYRNVMELQNRQSQLNVEFNLYKRLSDDSLQLANGGVTEFEENSDRMVLEFINKEPHKTVFLNLLWVSANKEVAQVFPHNATSEEIIPENTIRIGHDSPLTAYLAANYYYDIGCETLKAFFTTQPVDFRWLNQQGVRNGEATATNIDVIDEALDANPNERHTTDTANSDWNVIARSLLLSRKLAS